MRMFCRTPLGFNAFSAEHTNIRLSSKSTLLINNNLGFSLDIWYLEFLSRGIQFVTYLNNKSMNLMMEVFVAEFLIAINITLTDSWIFSCLPTNVL